jgi:hypothetical protein
MRRHLYVYPGDDATVATDTRVTHREHFKSSTKTYVTSTSEYRISFDVAFSVYEEGSEIGRTISSVAVSSINDPRQRYYDDCTGPFW